MTTIRTFRAASELLGKLIVQLRNDGPIQRLSMSDELESVLQFLTTGMPKYGLTDPEYTKFRQKIQDKIKGLESSAAREALAYVESNNEATKALCQRYQAEAKTLHEVLVELDRAYDVTIGLRFNGSIG